MLSRILGFAIIMGFPIISMAEGLCTAIFYKEIANKHMNDNDFTTSRELNNYSYEFEFRDSAPFSDVLLTLPSKAVWFDMGMGQGLALKQGLELNTDVRGVGVSYKHPTHKQMASFETVRDRVTLLEGDYVEVMALKGRLEPWMGRVALITDVYGPISYTHDLSRVLQVYMDLLRPGGVIMFNLGTSRNYNQDKYLPALESINTFLYRGYAGHGALYNWLLSIPGIEVADLIPRPVEYMGKVGAVLSVKIRKTSLKVQVPELLLLDYVEGKPPHRVFIAL